MWSDCAHAGASVDSMPGVRRMRWKLTLLLFAASSLVEAAIIDVTATCAGTGVVSSHTVTSARCTTPLTQAGASVGISTTGATVEAFAGIGHGTFETPPAQARAFLDLSYEFTFHGPAGSGGRYQPCLTEEHGWFSTERPSRMPRLRVSAAVGRKAEIRMLGAAALAEVASVRPRRASSLWAKR